MKKILVVASMMLLGFSGANAAGTAADTDITNSATLNYTVGGTSQAAIVSNTDTFKVDKKIDFTLVHNDTPRHLIVAPGNTAKVRQFTLTNTGNAVQDFTLDATNLTGSEVLDGKIDTEDVANFEYSLDSTTWSATAPTINNLAVDGAQIIYVRSDIPTAPTGADGDIMNIQLEATAVQDGTTTAEVTTSGADNATTVETVLAEGAGVGTEGNARFNGKFSAWAGYEIKFAILAIVKNSCVVSDPTGSANPHRIPGAIIRYNINIANTGSADATSVSISDSLVSQFGISSANLAVHDVECPVVSNPCAARAGTAEGGTHTGAGTNSVTLDFGSVAASTANCGYIEVTIQ